MLQSLSKPWHPGTCSCTGAWGPLHTQHYKRLGLGGATDSMQKLATDHLSPASQLTSTLRLTPGRVSAGAEDLELEMAPATSALFVGLAQLTALPDQAVYSMFIMMCTYALLSHSG